MKKKKRIMSKKPLNAETPVEYLRSYITSNSIFFNRNQGAIPEKSIPITEWELVIEGEVKSSVSFNLDQIYRMPKAIVTNTLECSGNSRSLFKDKASGNPWTIGGVGNAVWGGVWLKELLNKMELKETVKHVAFEGLDKPLGPAQIDFIRSIPIEKALDSTLLAYEMNGEPLPIEHGYPVRALALGWTGANCVKWLHRITLLDRPFGGFFMDQVYRIYQKGQDPKTGEIVTHINLKSIITQPQNGQSIQAGIYPILGAAYAGEKEIASIEVSVNYGKSWNKAGFIGPHEPFAWRQWQYIWEAYEKRKYTILSRSTDTEGNQQPMEAKWNVLGYGNNGISEHAVIVQII